MRTKFVGAAVLFVGASASTAWAANPPDTTGNNIALQGSDTLEEVTKAVLLDSRCLAAAAPQNISYAGGGSGTGETAMSQSVPTQKVAPMSRFFNTGTGVCAQGRTAEGLVIGLDGLAIVGASSTAGTCSGGMVFSGSFAVTDTAGSPVVNCPGCDAGTSTYTISGATGWKDVLKLIFTGVGHDGTRDCAGNVRRSLVNQWSKLFQGACTSGACAQLSHAYRRGDGSGTQDAFLSALGSPLSGVASGQIAGQAPKINFFCNNVSLNTAQPAPYPDPKCTGAGTGTHGSTGTGPALDAACTAAGVNGGTGTGNVGLSYGGQGDYLDNDPIRRTCDAKDQVCQHQSVDPSSQTAPVGTPGDMGLVLAVDVPTNLSTAQLYPTQACSTGKFALALPKPSGDPALLPSPPCPTGGGLTFGACFQPFFQATSADSQHFNCLHNLKSASGSPLPVQGFLASGTFNGVAFNMTDGRAYNLYVKDDATGNYKRDGFQVPQTPGTFAATLVGGGTPAQIQRLTTGAFFRKHVTAPIATGASTCNLGDSTAQIGCLVQADPCSLGFAGREAEGAIAGTPAPIAAMAVNNVTDSNANIAKLLASPVPADVYPIARKLFFNTLFGFENLVPSGQTTSGEFELAKCMGNSAIVNPIMSSKKFVPMDDPAVLAFNPTGKAICQDLDETIAAPTGCGLAAPNVNHCTTLPAGLIQ